MPEEGSERELEEFLAGTGAFTAQPPEAATTEEETETETEVVHDDPARVILPGERETPPEPAPSLEEKPVEEEAEEQQPEEQGDPHVVWATKKFGAEPERWAKAAYEREQHISRITESHKQAEEAAQQAIAYAREVEANANAQAGTGMPMSAAEEQWVEQSMANPVGYAYQAAMAGNVQLYNAVIEKIAEMDPGMAANVGTQVQLAMHNERQRLEAEHASRNGNTPDFNADLGQSFQRLGIDVQQYGEAMWNKFEELGEYHPYTLAVLGGDPIQRDLAVSAVYDLVRTGQTTTRRVADTQREEQIRREGELRRDAASIVTGAPHVSTPKQSPFFDAMEEEWRRRGQWYDEEK